MEMNKHVTSAFRLAHRASEDAERFDAAARNVFRAIARELYAAYGDPVKGAAVPAAEVKRDE